MSYLELLPAVDVKDGRAVRLVQGELDKESVYGAPLDVALYPKLITTAAPICALAG